MQRIGILGGTFNPVHIGHLILGEEAVWKLKLDRLIYIPSYVPPHKDVDIASPEDRFNMVDIAIEDNPHFEVSRVEIDNKGTSYSVNTLRELKKNFGEKATLFFITGSDSLRELFSWKDVDEIFKLSNFVVAQRPGYPVEEVPENIQTVVITPIEISSSEVRRRIKEARSIRYLVPDRVRNYIYKKKLYI